MSERHSRREHVRLIVTSKPPGKLFAFALDPEGREVFIHASSCVPKQLFDQMVVNQRVDATVIVTSKGARAQDLRALTAEEQEHAGNVAEANVSRPVFDVDDSNRSTFDNDERLQRRSQRRSS